MMPRDMAYRNAQGEPLESRPNPIPMPDGPTRSCCPLDVEYETGPVKGKKCRMEDGDPEVLLKQARRERNKGKGKEKATSGTL